MESPLASGLRKLKGGAILVRVSSVLLAIVLLAGVTSLALSPPALLSVPPAPPVGPLAVVAAAVAALGPAAPVLLSVLGLAALALTIACYALWFMASGSLKRHSPRLGIGRLGVGLVLAELAVLAVAASIALVAAVDVAAQVAPGLPAGPELVSSVLNSVLAAAADTPAIAVVVAVASIVGLIGHVPFGVMLIRLSKELELARPELARAHEGPQGLGVRRNYDFRGILKVLIILRLRPGRLGQLDPLRGFKEAGTWCIISAVLFSLCSVVVLAGGLAFGPLQLGAVLTALLFIVFLLMNAYWPCGLVYGSSKAILKALTSRLAAK